MSLLFNMLSAAAKLLQSCLTLQPYGLWTPLSMGFSRQEYWSGLPCPPSGDLPNPGFELGSLALQADSIPSEPPEKPKNTGVGSLCLLQGIFPIPRVPLIILGPGLKLISSSICEQIAALVSR